MNLTNDDLISGLVGDFYEKIQLEKQATSDGVGDKEKNSPQGQTQVQDPTEKDLGKEKEEDLKKVVNGNALLATSNNAKVAKGDGYEHPQGEIKELDVDQPLNQPEDKVIVNKYDKKEAVPFELAKVARADRLGTALVNKIIEATEGAYEGAPMQKTAAEIVENADPRAVEAFVDFNAGFERGIQKKAQDIADTVESGLAPDEETAEALLDAVAEEDPAAVLPEEAQPEAELDEETIQVLDELSSEMAAAGVTAEDLAEAVDAVAELADAGVPPEQIIDEVTAMADEAQVEDMEKTAAENRQLIRNRLQALYS